MILGVVLLVLGTTGAIGRFARLIPQSVSGGLVGALLILAGTDLAISRRLFDARPSCWPVIGITALVTLTVNPAIGLVAGWLSELVRAAIVRRLVLSQ